MVAVAEVCTGGVVHVWSCGGRGEQCASAVAFGLASYEDVVTYGGGLFGLTADDVLVHIEFETLAGTAVFELVAGANHVAIVEGSGLAALGEIATAVAFTAVFCTEVTVLLAIGGALLVGHVWGAGGVFVKSADTVSFSPATDKRVCRYSRLVLQRASRSGLCGSGGVEFETVASTAVLRSVTAANHVAIFDRSLVGGGRQFVAAVAYHS